MAIVANTCYSIQPRYVEAAPVVQLKFGLESVSEVIEDSGSEWRSGIEWQPWSCGPASVWPCPSCAQNAGNAPGTQKSYTQGIPLGQAFPFTVYGSFWCSPIASWDDAERRARENLINGRERAVEAEFLTGTNHVSTSVAGSASDITPTPGTPVTRAQGIALLEQWIGANASGQGVILGARRDILLAVADNAVVWPNSLGQETLYTGLTTPVAALGGVDGRTGPAATGAGNAWLFALGSRPRIRRSPIFGTERQESLNITNNNLQVLAEQTTIVSFDCGAAAVLVQSV